MNGRIQLDVRYVQTNILIWAAEEALRSAEYRECQGSIKTAKAAIELVNKLQESFVEKAE